MTINRKWNLQVDIMLHQSHAGVTWPTLLVVVTNYVFVVGVRVLRQVPLNQIPGLVGREPNGPIKVTGLRKTFRKSESAGRQFKSF